MTIAVMQPYFAPYLGYFQLVNRVDKFVIYSCVKYNHRGFINRNYIRGLNDKRVPLTIETDRKTRSDINKVKIDLNKQSFSDLNKKITLAYESAKYYDEIVDLIEDLFLYDFADLDILLEYQLRLFFKILNIETSIEFIRDGSVVNEDSLRNISNKQERIHERVFRLCRHFNSHNYVNAIGGIDLYDKTLFANEGLNIRFIAMKEQHFSSMQYSSMPFLSIIDVLMTNGISNTQKLLNEFDLY